MASRRSLVSRQHRDTPTHQAQRARHPTALPPYEAPSYPLTENAKRSFANITTNHDYRKYERHIKAAITNITNCAGDINDRLQIRKERVRKMAEKREATDPDAEKSRAEEEAEERVRELEEQVEKLTAESDKALRDLIDYKEELAEQGNLVEKVGSEAAANSDPTRGNQADRARRRQLQEGTDEEDANEDFKEDVEMEDVDSHAAILSPTELLKKAKEDYTTAYKSKSLRKRYADHNDYIGFKRMIHDSQHPGENKPPIPHASTWFTEDDAQPANPAAVRRRRLAARTDNSGNEDDDDDEIQMTGAISSLKCPLTLKTFKEPYSNHICKHTFEKSAILEYHHHNAVAFVDSSQAGRKGVRPQGPKKVKCPERGCDAMLELSDFYNDTMVARQVKRQQAAEMEDDMEVEEEVTQEDYGTPPSGQRSFGYDGASDKRVRDKRSQTLKLESNGQGLVESAEESQESTDPEFIEMDE